MMMLIPLLLCLLLCGCGQNMPPAETTLPDPAAFQQENLQASETALTLKYGDALQVYPLSIRKVQGMRAMDDGLLVFSGCGSTTLTRLEGDALAPAAKITIEFELDPHDPSLQLFEDALSYFDPVTRETVVLNEALEEITRIAAVDQMVGSPLLSIDRRTIYYCTSTAIRAWDLETGIHRCVKELSYEEQALTGLHSNDTVLQCRILDNSVEHTLFLSSETGQLLQKLDGNATLRTQGEHYYASFVSGTVQSLVFGEGSSRPQELQPEVLNANCTFLPEQNAAVTVTDEASGENQLDYYALDSGIRMASLSLDALHIPTDITASGNDSIYILIYDPEYDCDVILRWDVTADTDAVSTMSYTGTYYTAESPDHTALAQCQAYAAQIGSKHGVEILVWKDAVAVQPWDYVFELEYHPRVIMKELALLEQRLDAYPEGFLADTASHFSGLKICLVGQITGSPESGSLNTATGIQFFDDADAYVAIAVGEHAAQALYHELFHVMETHIFNESTAFDQWEKLNPAGFAYDYDYTANATRDSGIFLNGEHRAFVDTYSMSYPKEDRARIMEYAILPGNEYLFHSEAMQAKLKALCQGIRDAYGLEKSEERFIWEQYLEKPLAYTK